MSTRPSKEEVLTAYRRSGLLESARQVFGQCGFARATMERIAQAADVAKGTIYLYYPSKQSIYDAALHGGLDELAEMTRRRLSEAPSLREAVAAFINARAEYFLERRDFFRMYVAAVSAHVTDPAAAPSELHAWVDRQKRPLEELIAGAVVRREIRGVDPAVTALAIFDLTRGLVARRLMERTSDPAGLQKETALLTELIWRGLAPAVPSRRRRATRHAKRPR